MQPTHSTRRCEFSAFFVCALGLMMSAGAVAQAPSTPPPPPPAPEVAPAPPPPPPPQPVPEPVPVPVQSAPYTPTYPAARAPDSEREPPREPKERPSIFFGYEIALPTADLRDFTSDASFRGFEIGALWPVMKSLHVGAVFNHHLFYEEEGNKTYQLDSGALTANLYRYVKVWTIAAAARYHFLKPDVRFRPYVGLRAGIAFTTSATLVSDLSIYDTPTGFALSPEGGVLVRLAPIMHLSGAIRYDFSTASSDAIDNVSYLSYQFALVFHPEP